MYSAWKMAWRGKLVGGHVMTTVITLKVMVTHVREGKGGGA